MEREEDFEIVNAPEKAGPEWGRIILFGDSLTQRSFEYGGWGAQLTNFAQRRCDVVCRGFSGYTTEAGKYILPNILPASDAPTVRAVTILFGTNDATLKQRCNARHVPLHSYSDNLRNMIKYLLRIRVTREKIILITPPPLHKQSVVENSKTLGKKAPPVDNSVTRLYANAVVEISKDFGVQCVELWESMQDSDDWFSRYLFDGMHFTAAGQQFLFDKLQPIVNALMANSPSLYPPWYEMDWTNVPKSLSKPPYNLRNILAKYYPFRRTTVPSDQGE